MASNFSVLEFKRENKNSVLVKTEFLCKIKYCKDCKITPLFINTLNYYDNKRIYCKVCLFQRLKNRS